MAWWSLKIPDAKAYKIATDAATDMEKQVVQWQSSSHILWSSNACSISVWLHYYVAGDSWFGHKWSVTFLVILKCIYKSHLGNCNEKLVDMNQNDKMSNESNRIYSHIEM